ncbi:hypothetical protein [Streptomyces macrosporus]|uniref:Helix-turn-helix domain-containing protein n=1 Tax=Streptomyces macrosporus TaxID=44032 RepID=A0ABP5WK60_9ACTN
MEKTLTCPGSGCRAPDDRGAERPRTTAGGRLCPACRSRLAADLRRTPRLYDACGRVLGGGRAEPRERTSGGRYPSGMPFNTAAFEVRSAILGVLSSWTALVTEERGVTPPPRAVPELAAFLVRHLDWLAAHRAAGDLADEVGLLVRRARRLADPDPVRRVRIGRCAEPGCAGTLTARLGSDAPGAAEIRCDADTAHRWAGHEWSRLGRRLHRGEPGAAAGRPAWLTADEISRLWGIPSGSVYRLASERGWSRRRRGGRTYYDETEVRDALRDRTASTA